MGVRRRRLRLKERAKTTISDQRTFSHFRNYGSEGVWVAEGQCLSAGDSPPMLYSSDLRFTDLRFTDLRSNDLHSNDLSLHLEKRLREG